VVSDVVAAGRLCVPFLTALKARQYSVVHPTLPHKKEPMKLFCQWLVDEGASTPRLDSKTLDP
jgi:hypothetical protein